MYRLDQVQDPNLPHYQLPDPGPVCPHNIYRYALFKPEHLLLLTDRLEYRENSTKQSSAAGRHKLESPFNCGRHLCGMQ